MTIKLKDIYLFKGINEELSSFIIDNSRRVEYYSGDYVLHEGQESDGNAYIIQSGKAKVEISGEIVKTIGEGDIFGEIALITNEKRTASIRAENDLILLKINKKLLHKIIKEFKNGKEIQKEMLNRIIENQKRA